MVDLLYNQYLFSSLDFHTLIQGNDSRITLYYYMCALSMFTVFITLHLTRLLLSNII